MKTDVSLPNPDKIAPYLTDEARWKALIQRDSTAEGEFFYSVRTTGVYCRPTCSSRLPKRENVQFHETSEAAERAGFRACKRCQPNGSSLSEHYANVVAKACRLIETSEKAPALAALANAVGMSPFYFHRIFSHFTGLTPKAYATARLAEKVRQQLPQSASVTEAIYEAGFDSSSRFYAQSSEILGMPAQTFRSGGAGVQIRFAVGESALGSILVAASEKGICAILMGNDPNELAHNLQHRFPKAQLIGGDSEFEKWVAQVVGFVENPKLGLNLPLDIQGTVFQQRVWQALREIPLGETRNYTEIAQRIGLPKAARAVALACGANRHAVAIPCHRVVRTDGGISGYRWGVERKRALLQKEGVDV